MKKIFPLLIALLLLFLGLEYGRPFLENLSAGTGRPTVGGMSEGAICVRQAQQAANAFRRKATQFEGKKVESKTLVSALEDIDERLKSAQTNCVCNSESCAQGKEGVKALRAKLRSYNKACLKGPAPGPKMRGIDAMLDRAADIASAEDPL